MKIATPFSKAPILHKSPCSKRSLPGRLLLALLLLFSGSLFPNHVNAYCTTGLGGFNYAIIDSVSIVGTPLQNGPTYYNSTYYASYPASGSTTATLVQGSTYTLYVRYGTDPASGLPANAIGSLWIDYDQNGTFDASEWVQISTNAVTATVSFTVPSTALPGTTGMRIRSRGQGNTNGASNACTNFGSGETEDYTVTIVSPVPCSGTPNGGTTVASPSTVCFNGSSTLTLTGASISSGIAYQWQSFNTTTSLWQNITGATSPGYTTGALAVSTQYRCQLTCTNGTPVPAPATSTPVTVVVSNGILPPYSETFESITANNGLPQCMAATSLGTYVYTYTSPTGSYNQTNHTPGGSKFASFRWSCNDYIFTPGVNLTAGQVYQVSFWYITDGYTGWNTLQAMYGTAQNAGAMTLIGTPVTNPVNTTYQQFVTTVTAPTTGTYYFSIFCNANGNPWYLSVDDINVVALPPCSGQPTAGTIVPAGPINGCAGTSYSLTTTGTTTATGLTYQWLQYPNGVTTPQPAVGTGANTLYFTTPALSDTIRYRMVVTCNAGGLRDTTPYMTIYVPKVLYAPIPYTQDFESWINRCSTSDVPDASWTNMPSTSNNSWRRDDQGVATSGWFSNIGNYTPPGAVGSHSARFHTFDVQFGIHGHIDMYVNCSTVTGNKELQFYYINTDGSDTLAVSISTDGGATFSYLGSYYNAASWELETLPIVSNSATTIIRFDATSDYGVTDIGIDYARVLPPCSGQPVAGTVNPVLPCANTDFSLSLTGGTQSAGLSYQWQLSATGTGGWVSAGITNATQMIATANISQPTYFRCIVTCTNSSLSDTTAPYLVQIAPFYFCYCSSYATSNADDDIGNVTVTSQGNTVLLNNGNASPLVPNPTSINTYSDFRNTIPPVPMYKDSLYNLFVTQIDLSFFYTCTVGAFIDYNRDGIFQASEQIASMITSSGSTPPQQVTDTFRVPDTAQVGITGFRVVLVEGTGSVNPCGTYTWGETEDYLAEIKFPPCDGPTNPGIAAGSDTAMCIGYPLQLSDSTHEHQMANISWQWEQSTNNGNTWAVMPNSLGKDTLVRIFTGPSLYRLQMICTNTGDTTYSNIIQVNGKPPYKCYCYSTADGGINDTSDIGAFTIGNFVVSAVGPHLLNPQAIRGRADYTDLGPIELYADSSYLTAFYHILRSSAHADARITMFMDFNNNLQYDIPSERITLDNNITTLNNWYLTDTVAIPDAVVPDVPTGLRVILNNNVGPNVPSDEACGPYTSGETADFVVIFRRNMGTGVNNIANIRELVIYPNPTSGKFAIDITAATQLQNLQLRVTNITGQQIILRNYENPLLQLHDEMDMTGQAKGIYFVEITADGAKMIRKLIVR